MVICVFIPRFELAIAAGGSEALVGKPVAIAPISGQKIGEVSGSAQALGVREGMKLGEALTHCPDLELVPPDPIEVTAAWERRLRSLESLGAAVEPQRPGIACFESSGLRRIHGGTQELVAEAARRALRTPARIALAPTRFCALAGALSARPRRTLVVREPASHFLAPRSVALLRSRTATTGIVRSLERLGIQTLGALAELPRDALADRFGSAGIEAHRLANGEDDPPIPRSPDESLSEILELPESALGAQLEHALGLLVDRLLARPERDGRMLRGATLAAQLVGGGSWRVSVTFREALSDPERMRLALGPQLTQIPAPATTIALASDRLSIPSHERRSLLDSSLEERRSLLVEAVHQLRSGCGPQAALRAIALEPNSHVPERRAALTPFDL